MSARSCDQLCPITTDHICDADSWRAEPIIGIPQRGAPAVPPVSVHQCQLSVLIHATCQCPSVPHQCHISVPPQCTSMPHISAHLSCLSVSPISAAYQCQSVPPISASQCCLSVLPFSAHQCCLSMPISATYQCLLVS
ncbi:unnamed protein product, partial [Staurois parvus]